MSDGNDVDFHPNDSRQAIAGGIDNGQAYFSTDGGLTWRPPPTAGIWSGQVEVMYAARDASVAYASSR